MNLLSLWRLRRLLRRGEKALSKGSPDQALQVFEQAWNRLTVGFKGQEQRRSPLMIRALSGVDRSAQALGAADRVLPFSRQALRLDPTCVAAVELTGRSVLSLSPPLDAPGCDDLVRWATHSDVRPSERELDAIENLLREFLNPAATSAQLDSQVADRYLDRLSDGPLKWGWAALFAAELARRRQAWRRAADCLVRANGIAPNSAGRLDRQWQIVRCLASCGEWKPARDAAKVAVRLATPTRSEWLLTLTTVLFHNGEHERALKVACTGVRRHRSRPFLDWIEQLVSTTQEFELVAQALHDAASKARLESERHDIARILCRLAICRRSDLLLRSLVDTLQGDPADIPEDLRLIAATAQIAWGRNSSKDLHRFVQPCVELQWVYRVVVTWCWTSRGNWSKAYEAINRLSILATDANRPAWERQFHRITVRVLGACNAIDEFLELVSGHSASSTADRELIDWVIAATAKQAIQEDSLESLLPMSSLTADTAIRSTIGCGMVRYGAKLWNAAPSTSTASHVLSILETATLSGAVLTHDLLIWYATLAHLAKHADVKEAADAIEFSRAPRHQQPLVAFLKSVSGIPQWDSVVEQHANIPRDEPLGDWLTSKHARNLALRGDWSGAARTLGSSDEPMQAVIRKLGDREISAERIDAWVAFQSARWKDCLDATCRYLESQDSIDPQATLVALIAADQIEHSGTMVRDAAEPLRAALVRLDIERHGATHVDLPWLAAARLGFLDSARHGISRHLLCDGASSPVLLHAWALTSLALSKANPGKTRTTNRLLEVIGVAATFCSQPQSFREFVAARFAEYAHDQSLSSAEQLSNRFSSTLLACLSQHAASLGWERNDIMLAWQLESEAAVRISARGGIPVNGASVRMSAGPCFALAIGAADGVRAFFEEAVTSAKVQADADAMPEFIQRLTGGRSGSTEPGTTEESFVELRRLFSPLGPAAILLQNRQFSQVFQELDAVCTTHDASFSESSLRDLLWSFVDATKDEQWLVEQCEQLRLECRIQMARELVGRVPVDFDALRELWDTTLIESARSGRDELAKRCIAELAVGRSAVLVQQRSREEKRSDRVERRSNRQRRAEGRELLRLAWATTQSEVVQGPLTNILNQDGVEAAHAKNYEEAVELLIESLTVKPNAKVVADNLANIMIQRLHDDFDDAEDTAFERFDGVCQRLHELLAERDSEEIEAAITLINANRHYPFSHRAAEAFENDDFRLSTEMMIRALATGQDNESVLQSAQGLANHLRDKGESELLEQLLEAAPPGALDAVHSEEFLEELLAHAFASATGMTTEAEELNRDAVAAANAQRFPEAVRLLMRAYRLCPKSPVIQQNGQRISTAWANHAMGNGDFPAFLQAMDAFGEFT